MASPSKTDLWRRAFTMGREDASSDEQCFFRLQLESMRGKAKTLVSRIAADTPGGTVHDETHLDALWELASFVASPDLAFNPPEAFVFGSSVLIHDAAMTVAAYPGGLVELKATTTWADAAALYDATRPRDEARSPESRDSEREVSIQTTVLRRLHAEKAKELATQGWLTGEEDDGERVFLIDDPEIRRYYGPSIGALAYSHWWPIDRVERELSEKLGALPLHTGLEIDRLKLALLLRVADALHLDVRRAPCFVRALERPQGLSALHWTFQEKLGFPRHEDDAVVFDSGESFEAKDAEAWWLAYDAFVVVDRELREADLVLRNRGGKGLRVRRVKGIGDPQEVARTVTVLGWRPVETRVRVSDVPKIVETLGGDKLYGDDASAPLRELLQNAMDAVQARRLIQNRPSDWGKIVVELSESRDGVWLSVEDNGVGMSEAVLTGPLLDFGSSFWRSSRITEEFPGLAGKGMDAVGRFGIGFFSVWMLGDHVRVTTRRYDLAENDALQLEFRGGLASRPVLSSAQPAKAPLDGGTLVEVKLQVDPRTADDIYLRPKWDSSFRFPFAGFLKRQTRQPSLAELVAFVAPASEVSIDTVQFERSKPAISGGDWLTISAAKLVARTSPYIKLSAKDQEAIECQMRLIALDGSVFGRAALWPSDILTDDYCGVLTVGGLRVTGISNLLGIVGGEVTTAARDIGRVTAPSRALSKWATEQARLIETTNLPDSHNALAAEIILECGGSILSLPVAKWRGEWLNSDDLAERFASESEISLHVGDVRYDDDVDTITKNVFEHSKELNKEIVFVPKPDRPFASPEPRNYLSGHYRQKSFLRHHIGSLLDEAWGGYENDYDERVVGHAEGEEILRDVEIFRRQNDKAH